MTFKNLSVSIAVAIVLATTSTVVKAEVESSNTTRVSSVRTVKPWDDIVTAIESDAEATFTISASHFDFEQEAILPPDVEESVEESTFSFGVKVANQAVTADTLIRDEEGNLVRMGEIDYSLLVASPTDQDDGTVVLISVDHKTGETNGVVQKKGAKAMHIHQRKGRSIVSEEEAEFVPPAWACNVAEEIEDDRHHNRHLEEDGLQHNHHHHDHDHHHHNEHDDHGLDGNDLSGSFENLRKSLRGRGTDVSRQEGNMGYSYQVDMYIEFDQQLVTNNGGLQGAHNYINALFTMANTIYEREIDTHLNVVQMELTTNYDKSKNTFNALSILRKKWGGKWNVDVDLHHAILGKRLGGGIAYVGVVCNKKFGFGVSASMSGDFTSMDAGMTWDSMVVTHEIGHNFNSGHTFDGYKPAVDTCMYGKCPNSIVADSATLMSYCHHCGGYGKVEYTFGGEYDGSGSKSDLSNWKRSDKLKGNTSIDPQRVPHKMFQHVSTRGNCVAPH